MLNGDVELLDGMPIAYIKSINAIAVADLHLGYEGIMAKRGVYLPKTNLRKIMEGLSNAIDETHAKSVVANGDIKNEFSDVDEDEFNELFDFIKFLKEKKVEPVLIKGNHDNFVERYKEAFKLRIYRQEAVIGTYHFFHGEEMPGSIKKGETLVMGHEHPAIAVFNSVGKREKLRCFLYGKYKGSEFLVLPAMNYFAAGTEINMEPADKLLSPIFKELDVDSLRAMALGYGSTMDFGTIGRLRNVY